MLYTWIFSLEEQIILYLYYQSLHASHSISEVVQYTCNSLHCVAILCYTKNTGVYILTGKTIYLSDRSDLCSSTRRPKLHEA